MKFLKKSQLHLVKPKFKKLVLEAWEKGEDVPHSVIYLSSVPPTEKDIEHTKIICSKR